MPLSIAAEEAGGKPRRIPGAKVTNSVQTAVHDLTAIAHLPPIIAEASRGDYRRLTGLVGENLAASRYAWGLRYWSSEEFPFEDGNAMTGHVSSAQGLGGLDLGPLPSEVSDAWQVPPAAAKEN